MQELIDMLRDMAGVCKSVAAREHVGRSYAIQAVDRGSMPGIRAGINEHLMIRITLEKPNNVDNVEAAAWNTLWVDAEPER